VCGVCVHELLHKCGGIVFADVWGDLHICNCVRIQAPTAATAPSADAVAYAELQEKYKTLEGKLNAANDTIEEQRKVLEAAEKTRQELQAEVKKVETEIKTWKDPCIQRMEELKVIFDFANIVTPPSVLSVLGQFLSILSWKLSLQLKMLRNSRRN
jgi:hypothetical protein